jgi:hypothetical protein
LPEEEERRNGVDVKKETHARWRKGLRVEWHRTLDTVEVPPIDWKIVCPILEHSRIGIDAVFEGRGEVGVKGKVRRVKGERICITSASK